MMKLTFVTGNVKKLKQAQNALIGYDIELVNECIDTPEIQDTNIENVAKFSAKFASNQLHKPVVLTDAGYYIKSLNGFPGPFIKQVNQWLTPTDILNMMTNKTNREIVALVCVAYCEPGFEPICFVSENRGKLAAKAEGEGSTIDKLFIPDGYLKPVATLPESEKLTLWNNQSWRNLADYLLHKNPNMPRI